MALFDSAALTEKLSKLNASAQSIETLSQWCLFHRKKSREVRPPLALRNAQRTPRARRSHRLGPPGGGHMGC